MHDPLVVRRREAAGQLHRAFDCLADGQDSRLQPLPQRLALEQLGDEIGRALVVPDVVDGEHVGVVEDTRGARFVLEAMAARRVRADGGGKDLDRHGAAETGITRAVNLTHPAGPQTAEDLVRSQPLARAQEHEEPRSNETPAQRLAPRPRQEKPPSTEHEGFAPSFDGGAILRP